MLALRTATIVSALVLFSACGCHSASRAQNASLHEAQAPRPAAINHFAFFKLKDPADAAPLIADCDAMLGTIPGVVSYFAGRHLDTGRGERIDSNYDVAFYVGFQTQADYARYVEHPRHKAMLQKWQPRWESIRVLDVLDATP
jgi:hypothetical protein